MPETPSFIETARLHIQAGQEVMHSLREARAFTASKEFTEHFPVRQAHGLGYKGKELRLFELQLARHIHESSGASLHPAVDAQAEEYLRREILRRTLQIQQEEGGDRKIQEITHVSDRFGQLYGQYVKDFASLDDPRPEARDARVAIGHALIQMEEAISQQALFTDKTPTASQPRLTLGASEARETRTEAAVLFGPYTQEDFAREYPHSRYLHMVEDAFPTSDAERVEERKRLWQSREYFWQAMQQAERNGTLRSQDFSECIMQTMRATIAEVDTKRPEGQKESPDFERFIPSHVQETGQAIATLAEALRDHDPQGKFLTSRNLDLLQMMASIHDVFNGFATLKGQIMLDHQFLFERFAMDFLREGQTINVDGKELTLTTKDAKFLQGITRHENIFEEKKWENLASTHFGTLRSQIAHAKSLMLAADILGSAITVEDTTVELGEPTGEVRSWREKRLVLAADQLPKRLGDVMRRHLAHVDDKGIPIKDEEGKTDGKIFRPEWLLTAKTLALTFTTLWRDYGIPVVNKGTSVRSSAQALVGTGLEVIQRAQDEDTLGQHRYTVQQEKAIYDIQQELSNLYSGNLPVFLDHARWTDQTLAVTVHTPEVSHTESTQRVEDSTFVEWREALSNPPVIKGVIGGYEDAAFLAGPTADKGKWRETFLTMLANIAREDPDYAHMGGDQLLAKMREVTTNPVIVGRDWEPSDAIAEALHAANDWVLLLHFPDEPELGADQEYKGTGSIVERGAFYANIVLRGNVLVAAIADTVFNLEDDVQRARAKSFADIARRIPPQLRKRFIVTQTLEEAARVVWDKLKEFENQPKERQEVALRLEETPEEYERSPVINQVYFSGTSKEGTHALRDAIKERLVHQGVPVGDSNLGIENWTLERDSEEIWPAKLNSRIEVITIEPDPHVGGQITGLGALEDVTDAFFRLSLGAYDQEESGEHQYKFILLPDITEHPELLTGEFQRAYGVIMQHYQQAQNMPGFDHHIKIFTSREELEKHLDATVAQYFPQTAS